MTDERPAVAEAVRFISLFSGVGGFDLGLEAAGWECVAQVEWDTQCQQVLARRWPDVPRWGDVSTVSGADLPAADVIAFGSPCQDLSAAGKRAGLSGSRSGLFYEAIRIIKEMQSATDAAFPQAVIWENVAGAIASSNGSDFGAVLDALADCGAVVIEWAVLDSAFFGVPHHRRRLFVVAIIDRRAADRCPDPLLPLAAVAPGHCKQDALGVFYRTHGKQDRPEFGRAPALKAGTPVCVVGALVRPRVMTPVEHERLMGWPDDHTRWQADGTEVADSRRYKMCGNGVVAPVATWLASCVNRAMR